MRGPNSLLTCNIWGVLKDAPQLPLWSETDTVDGWRVRQSRRARRLTVRVFHTGRVEVVVPPRTSSAAIQRFIENQREWIERKRAEARANAIAPEPFPPSEITFTACDEHWRVHLAGGKGRVRLTTSAPGLLVISGDTTASRALRTALRSWVIERGRAILVPALEQCAHELQVPVRRVLVRRQRTRWGSCSANGTISLNCCLLFQRPPVVRYLLIHELAHVHHMNHSARFWSWVARHCPDYRNLDRELLDGWRRVPSWVFGDTPGHA